VEKAGDGGPGELRGKVPFWGGEGGPCAHVREDGFNDDKHRLERQREDFWHCQWRAVVMGKERDRDRRAFRCPRLDVDHDMPTPVVLVTGASRGVIPLI
jgi:hypothetical protein